MKLIRSPNDWMAATTPSVIRPPLTASKYGPRNRSCPPSRSPSSRRAYLKNSRSLLGTVKTTWRWGTSRSSLSRIHSPHSSSRMAWQEGRSVLRLRQEASPAAPPGGVRAADTGEPKAGVAVVKVALDDLPDYQTEESIFLPEPAILLGQEKPNETENHY